MPRFVLDFGSEVDLLNKAELQEALREDAEQRAKLAGIKYRRLPMLQGKAQAGTLDIGGDNPAGWSGRPVGPASGWMWEIKLLSVAGLTAGGTPDVVNLYINGAQSSLPWWQFNGNNFAYTFGREELVMYPQEYLRLAGTIAATGTVTLFGSMRQIPAEKSGML